MQPLLTRAPAHGSNCGAPRLCIREILSPPVYLVQRFASGCGFGTISPCGSIQRAFRDPALLADGNRAPKIALVSSSSCICAHHVLHATAQRRVLAIFRLHRLCSRHAFHGLVFNRLSTEKHQNACDELQSRHLVLRRDACMLALNPFPVAPASNLDAAPVRATASHTLILQPPKPYP